MLSLTILLSDQLSVLLKETIQRLRPVYDPQIDHLVHNVFRKGGLYGFVSSHAANSFAVFYFTHRLFKNKGYSVLLFFWALLMSYSRIYLGVHYPLDILGGAVLGLVTGLFTFKILMFIEVHFFLTGNPKIEKTDLSPAQSGLLFFTFCVVLTTVITVLSILNYYSGM
jgi:undecaprenyl-diphosphatase